MSSPESLLLTSSLTLLVLSSQFPFALSAPRTSPFRHVSTSQAAKQLDSPAMDQPTMLETEQETLLIREQDLSLRGTL
jgi:hypothetical protein